MKIITKKKLREECWNLDFELIKWLNEHFTIFKEEAIGIVDLEFYKFTYKRKEYTQLEIVERIIEITNQLLDYDYFDCNIKKVNKQKDEMYDLLKLVHWNMWW